jgi:hypothetical protein
MIGWTWIAGGLVVEGVATSLRNLPMSKLRQKAAA